MLLRINLIILLLSSSLFCHAQNISLSKEFVKLKGTEANVPSDNDTLIVNINGFTNNMRMVTTFPFELSKDGTNFNDSLLIPLSQSGINIPVYIRTLPNQNNIVYRGKISFQDGIFSLADKVYVVGTSILETKSVSTCSWNLKWFGSPTYCSCDTALSRQNTTTILKEIDADVIALQEVVSIPQLQQLVTDLGPKYNYVIAGYGSQIHSTSSPGYASTQKLAYIYNQHKLTNQGTYGLLQTTYPNQQGASSPYYYFASGRWPYGLSVKLKNSSEEFEFINMHAKAFAGSNEHNRRAGGALKMADSLNAHLPNAKIIVMGDYNDLIEGSITSGFTTSPYNYLFNNGFTGITLPSQYPGESTYIGSSASLIDNYVVSNEAYPSYVPNSTVILREADYAINNFKSTTSDHLPVLAYFKTNIAAAVNQYELKNKFILVQPNGTKLFIQNSDFSQQQIAVSVFSLEGKNIFSKSYASNEQIIERLDFLKKGLYFVQIQSGKNIEMHKWLVN